METPPMVQDGRAKEHIRRACACPTPDLVMQADGKFYCYTCSFETGARPNSLEPEAFIRQRQLSVSEGLEAALRALVEKWRARRIEARDAAMHAFAAKNYSSERLIQMEVNALGRCIGELEDALALLVSGGARQDDDGGVAETRPSPVCDHCFRFGGEHIGGRQCPDGSGRIYSNHLPPPPITGRP